MKKTIALLVLIATIVFGASSLSAPSSSTQENAAASIQTLEATPETGAAPANIGNYTLDTEKSTLEWEASRLAANPHIGTVAIKSGQLSKSGNEFVGGEFVIDMTQITEEKNNERFLTHVRGDDFFAVEKFPTSTLQLRKIEKQADGSYSVNGDLTILDQTHPVSFSAALKEEANDMLTATAEFQIDRTTWGIVFDSGSIFTQLGDRAIKDEITYRLNLSFQKS